jgi:signal transduction histidine kinase
MAARQSKNAGRALALIVLLLVLPMLLVGYFYYSTARLQISLLEKELAGSQLLQAVYPPLMSVDEKISEEQLARIHFLEVMVPSSKRGSFEERWANSMAQKSDMPLEKMEEMSHESLAHYFTDVATDSGLALESDPGSYFLVDAAILTLPGLVRDTRNLGDLMQNLALAPRDYENKVTLVSQLQGRVHAAREHFSDSLSRSARFGSEGENISKITAEGVRFQIEVDDFTGLIANASGTINPDTYNRFSQAQNSVAKIKAHAGVISKLAFVELDRKLNSRITTAKNKINSLMLLGLSTAALGLGLAHQLFRKTLTKLDQVETARAAASMAHADAERINDEIAILNRDLADKIKQLQLAQNEIVEKGRMEQLGQLTATIAHELRNPLGSVRTSAYLINRKVGGKGLGIDDHISRIEKGVVRCDNIITQLLDFSRTKKIAAAPANLDSWLTGIVTEEASKLPTNVQIDCILGLNETSVPFDPLRMQRAVINLLSNAAEAMTAKDISAFGRNSGYPQIWISTFKLGNEVAIRVKDNGPGIDAELLNKIREPLFTTKNFGTGLGIPAVEQIAAQHGGRLEIQSYKGEGAEFTIFIPSGQVDAGVPSASAAKTAVA